MKRIIFVLCAIIGLFAIIFVLQNRFIFGVPFVKEDQTTFEDLDRLLGTYYLQDDILVRAGSPLPPWNREYIVHIFSFMISGYDLESKRPPEFTIEPDKKCIVHSAHWTMVMSWSSRPFFDTLGEYP